MKKNTKKTTFMNSTIIILFLIFSCGKSIDQVIKSTPTKQFNNFNFDKKSTLVSRVKTIPEFVLNHWKKYDNRSDYEPYKPNLHEMKIIDNCFKKLPPLNRSIMKERILGIFFVKNFWGSGAADWVVNKDNDVYSYLIFNPIVLKKDLSEVITWKERTCFINDNKDIKITIDCGKKYNGFLYILIHESTHVVDYVNNITPYVEKNIMKYLQVFKKKFPETTNITRDVWETYNIPRKKYHFREKVTFYGFSDGPKMKISNAVNIYEELSESSFISLYGSRSWAEDLAELVTFYHLTEKLKEKYIINVYKNDKIVYSLEPSKSPGVRKRFNIIKMFY